MEELSAQSAQIMESTITYLSQEQTELALQELEQTKEEVKDMYHTLDDMRHNFKNKTEEVSQRLRERSEVYTKLEEKLNFLPEIYGREIEEIISLKQVKNERIYYQNNDRLEQIAERLRMLDTKVSGIQIHKERDVDSGDLDMISLRDLGIRIFSGLIYLLIYIFHAIFFLLSIVQDIIKPFTSSISRIITSSVIFVLIGIIYFYRNQLVMIYLSQAKVND